MDPDLAPAAVSFDLFGTLIEVVDPPDPAAALEGELANRGIPVPVDWECAYAETHVPVADGAELPLPVHVRAALQDRGIDVDESDAIESAVAAAFDGAVRTRPGARAALTAARERGPVGILSNCSVPGLARRSLERSALEADLVDAVITSVDCGWRKPDPRAFHEIAAAVGVAPDRLLHVGDDPLADGGAANVGATSVLIESTPLTELADTLGER